MLKKLIIILISLTFSFSNILAAPNYNKTIFKKINFKKIKNFSLRKYPTSRGSILVTPDFYKKILPVGHAAIVIDKNYVYETTAKGVIRGLNNWVYTKKITFGLKVKNLSQKALNKSVASLSKYLGKKYNFNFFNTKTRNKFYCSHLIWSIFFDRYKINLDTKLFGLANNKRKAAIHPLELVLSKNTRLTFFHAKR